MDLQYMHVLRMSGQRMVYGAGLRSRWEVVVLRRSCAAVL
jgi:hypothetical protein